MSPQSVAQPGLYRIQTVARMTGVPVAVLRAWEKRYGVPRPRRTDAAYRLYTDADVNLVMRLSALRASGLAASEAARLVMQERSEAVPLVHPPTGGSERLLDAARRMDGSAIDETLASLAIVGNAADAFEQVVAPTLIEVGRLWESGEMSEAHEHLLSEHLTTTLRTWLSFARPANPRGTALIACFADELHTIPAYGLALRWSSLGMKPVLLGARSTPQAVRAAIRQMMPTVVGLSLTMPATEMQRACLREYSAACGRIPWVVGGAGAAGISRALVECGGSVLPSALEAHRVWLENVTRERARAFRR